MTPQDLDSLARTMARLTPTEKPQTVPETLYPTYTSWRSAGRRAAGATPRGLRAEALPGHQMSSSTPYSAATVWAMWEGTGYATLNVHCTSPAPVSGVPSVGATGRSPLLSTGGVLTKQTSRHCNAPHHEARVPARQHHPCASGGHHAELEERVPLGTTTTQDTQAGDAWRQED